MIKHLFAVLFFLTVLTALAQTADETSIQEVITSAYLDGIHNRGNIDDIRKGFHPSFEMLRLADNSIKSLPIEEWLSNIEKARAEAATPVIKTEGKFVNIDVTGNAATVKLELYRENKKIFTDYMALYKFNEGWRIVSKTFQKH